MSMRILAIFAVVVATSGFAHAADYAWESEWQESACYRGIDTKIVVKKPLFRDSTNQEARLYIHNRYQKDLSVEYEFEVNGHKADGRSSIIASGEKVSGGAWTTVPRNSFFTARAAISNAKIRGANGYAPCDK